MKRSSFIKSLIGLAAVPEISKAVEPKGSASFNFNKDKQVSILRPSELIEGDVCEFWYLGGKEWTWKVEKTWVCNGWNQAIGKDLITGEIARCSWKVGDMPEGQIVINRKNKK